MPFSLCVRAKHLRNLFGIFAVLLLVVTYSCNDSPVSSSGNTPPAWSVKDTMRVELLFDSVFTLKLSPICSDQQNDQITYQIKSIFPTGDTIVNDVYTMNSLHCTADSFTVSITASDISGLSSDLTIKFKFLKKLATLLSQDTLKSWILNNPPNDFVLIDVRGSSSQDFISQPYLIGSSKCKPYNLMWPDVFQQYCTKFTKDQHIVIHCKSGQRAELASTYLASLGYPHVYNAGGAMTWLDQSLQLPLSDTLPLSNIPKPSMLKSN